MIVATLASLASRVELLERTVASLAPQVDAICVYGNGYARVPDCLRHEKVLHAVISVEAGWRGAEAKLWFWDRDEFKAAPAWKDDDIALVCDDDLVYPKDYAAVMCEALAAHPGAVACVHGSIMTEPFERYSESRMVARTVAELAEETRVHIPGTGTLAFRVGDLAPHLSLKRDVTWSHAVDPHVAVLCHKRGIPIWAVRRPARWITVQELPKEGMSIFPGRTGSSHDHAETTILKGAAPWPALPIAPDMTPRVAEVGSRFRKRKVAAAREIVQTEASMLPEQAFHFLETRLWKLPPGIVVELGSGFGTARILKTIEMNAKHVSLISVEHDERFVGLVERGCYIHAPIHNGWYDVRTLRARLPPADQIVAVIVDGPPAAIGRHRLAKNLDLFPPHVPMLIDDVQRDQDMELAKAVAAIRGDAFTVHTSRFRSFATLAWD